MRHLPPTPLSDDARRFRGLMGCVLGLTFFWMMAIIAVAILAIVRFS